jgi:RNA polymerase sigma factor (sigma-70 family)
MDRSSAHAVSRPLRAPRRVAKRLHVLDDEALLDETRQGSREAFGELWRRHSKAAAVAAQSFRDLAEPDDVVAEAFAKIFEALQNGTGPTSAFRPYLYVTVRNLAHRRLREIPVEDADLDELLVEAVTDPVEVALDSSITASAFRSLPERWQTVLWYTEVERMTARQTGELMGINANAVSALSFRARAALREAWVQGHVSDTVTTGRHRDVLAKLGAWSLGTLNQSDERFVSEHLTGCTRCRLIAEELDDVSKRLAVILLPLVFGAGAALLFERQLAAGGGAVTAASHSTFGRFSPRSAALVGGATVVLAAAVFTIAQAAPDPGAVVADAGHSAAAPPSVAPQTTPSSGTSGALGPRAGSVTPPSSDASPRPIPVSAVPPLLAATPLPGVTSPLPAQTSTPTPIPAPVPSHPVVTTPPAPPVHPPTTPTQPPALPKLAAPEITSPATVLTRSLETTITGTAPPGSRIDVTRDGAPLGSATTDDEGGWSYIATGLGEGPNLLEFRSAGSRYRTSDPAHVVITVDTIAPDAPVVTSVPSPTGATPYVLEGTAEPGSTITVTGPSGALLAAVTTGENGSWASGVIVGFSPAMAGLTLTATDAAGNVSAPTVAGPFAFAPTFTNPTGQTVSTPTVSVDLVGWPGSRFVLTLNGVAQGAFVFGDDGTRHLTLSSTGGRLSPGTYTFTAIYDDGAHTSTASATASVKVVAP